MPETATATQDAKKKPEKKPHAPRDAAREVVETIVFVVVLVLLLKLFITEAFVIPTGSMAETLYGYQKMVVCPECKHEFPVNSHDEVEGRQGDGRIMPLYGFTCPNCRYMGSVRECTPAPTNRTGDRVLVLKPLFHIREPRRGDVVVFKFPEKPQDKHTAQNYIKRAKGFGRETIAIHRGKLFATNSLTYDDDESLYPHPSDKLDLWKPQYMYASHNPKAIELFDRSRDAGFPPGPSGFGTGGFEIIRKGEDELLADARMVWDNDKQPEKLAGKLRSRWYAPDTDTNAWTADQAEQPRVFQHKGDAAGQHWIRYRHLSMPWKTSAADQFDPTPQTDFAEFAKQQPTYVDNFLGYNAGRDQDQQTGRVGTRDHSSHSQRWVGDLILTCKVAFTEGSEVTLELSKSLSRFQATFTEGKVTLSRIGRDAEKFSNPSRPCKIAAGKTHELRFANVDCRLRVWVDGKLIDFGTEGDYQPIEPGPNDNADAEGWTKANDIDAPASIGAKGKVTVQNIKLQRDIYYTRDGSDYAKADLFYVQPGHYLCLGDNSAQSSDSRKWGTVPERLMLGKAVFVFFPVNRVGFIK